MSTDQSTRIHIHTTPDRSVPSTKSTSPPSGSPADTSTIQQRSSDAEGQKLHERERQIRLREEDIERKAKELEYERLRIQRDVARHQVDFPTSDYTRRSPVLSQQQVSSSPRFLHHLHSHSATNLTTNYMLASPTQYTTRASPLQSPIIEVADHAPSCGCEACSASKYRTRESYPSPHDLRPPEPPITLRSEKPKGWIRRLSMPVMGNAFSSDSKKGITNLAITSSASGPYRTSLALPDEDGRLRYDAMGAKNRSTTTLGR